MVSINRLQGCKPTAVQVLDLPHVFGSCLANLSPPLVFRADRTSLTIGQSSAQGQMEPTCVQQICPLPQCMTSEIGSRLRTSITTMPRAIGCPLRLMGRVNRPTGVYCTGPSVE